MRPPITPGAALTRPAAESAVTLLPLPLSPTMPSVLAGRDVEADAVHRRMKARLARE